MTIEQENVIDLIGHNEEESYVALTSFGDYQAGCFLLGQSSSA
jgi:hypothetical protein